MSQTERVSLRYRVLRASWWTLGSYILNLTIRFGSNILITRLLAPDMFGLITIATTVSIGLVMLSDLGLKQNIVQSRRGNEPGFLNTAWTMQIIRGAILWFVAIGVSGVLFLANQTGQIAADSAYAADGLPLVIIVSSLSVFVSGFESTRLFEATRGLSLGRVTAIEILSQIARLVCMVGWAIVDRSVWVLVFGGLGASFMRVTLSHTILSGAPNRLRWDRAAAFELIWYGKWIFLSSILGFLVSSGDRLLLAGIVNSTALGLYAIASLIPVSIEVILNKIMADVSFPAFSEVVRERREDLSKAYYRFFGIIASISYFLAGFLMMSGRSIIHVLYDERYQQAGWMLELLSIVVLTIPSKLAVQCYLALGLPKLTSHVIFGRLVVLFIATPLAFSFFDFEGALSAIVLSQFMSTPIIYFYNVKHGLFDLRKECLFLLIVLVGMAAGKSFEWILRAIF